MNKENHDIIDFIEDVKKRFKVELYKRWDKELEKCQLLAFFDKVTEEAIMDL